MHVILLEDLDGLGARGATVNVKPGYARNYLLPRRLAIAAGTRAGNLYQELARQKGEGNGRHRTPHRHPGEIRRP